jgi:hypothetical protein
LLFRLDAALFRHIAVSVQHTVSTLLIAQVHSNRDSILAANYLPLRTLVSVSADADGDGVVNEAPQAVIDYLGFYLLNYFEPRTPNRMRLPHTVARCLTGLAALPATSPISRSTATAVWRASRRRTIR